MNRTDGFLSHSSYLLQYFLILQQQTEVHAVLPVFIIVHDHSWAAAMRLISFSLSIFSFFLASLIAARAAWQFGEGLEEEGLHSPLSYTYLYPYNSFFW